MRSLTLFLCSVAALAHLPAEAQPAPPKENCFDDLFFQASFQVSRGVPGYPVPEGPLLTVDEQRKEAHWRAGRAASCWLAGKCREANASRYDKGLAAPVEVALKAVPEVETVVPMLEVGTEAKRAITLWRQSTEFSEHLN